MYSAYGFGDDCPPGMIDDGDGGCAQPVPPTGGLEPYASPGYVPPTGGLYDYGVHGPEAPPTSTGMTILTALVLAPLFFL